MKRWGLSLVIAGLVATLAAGWAAPAEYEWNLPRGFPKPYVPADNPMSAAKVELGRHLFYDSRMSVNGKQSCASCHKQELAFTDGRAVGVGTTGELHSRSAMSLVNVAYSAVLTWSNPEMKSLEKQALVPMYGDHPVELGLKRRRPFSSQRCRRPTKKIHRAFLRRPFPARPIHATISTSPKRLRVSSAASAFRPLAHYDHATITTARTMRYSGIRQTRGKFCSSASTFPHCFRCHGGFNFSDATVSEHNADRGRSNSTTQACTIHVIASAPNAGIFEFTHDQADTGKFKARLRENIALTAPYMHDGSIPTLEGVIDHYAAGGRAHDNPNKDHLIGGFSISPRRAAQDLIEYLKSLTDTEVIHDPRFANPWSAASQGR